MIGDAIEYPLEGDDAVTTLVIGGAITLLSALLVVPGILVGGYSVAVCRYLLEGHREPPAFEDWGELAVDGLYVAAITLVYWLPAIVVGVVGLGAFSLVAFGLGGDAAALAGSVLFLLAAVGSLVGFGYALLVGYVLPAAIVNFARTGEVSAAWDLGTLRRIVADGDYAKAWVIGAVLLFAFNSAASSLVWLLVGFPILFFGQVAAMYVFTRGTMDALDIEPEPPEVVDRGVAGGEATGADGVPGPSDPVGSRTAGETRDDGGDVGELPTVGTSAADALRAAGYETVADLERATRAELADVDGIGPATADRIKSDLEG